MMFNVHAQYRHLHYEKICACRNKEKFWYISFQQKSEWILDLCKKNCLLHKTFDSEKGETTFSFLSIVIADIVVLELELTGNLLSAWSIAPFKTSSENVDFPQFLFSEERWTPFQNWTVISYVCLLSMNVFVDQQQCSMAVLGVSFVIPNTPW